MQIPPFQALRAKLTKVCQKLLRRARTAPREAYIAGGLCLVVVVLVGLYTVFSQKTAVLRLHVQHSFRAARIEVSVDDEPAYSGKLTGTPHKKFGLLPEGIQGSSLQSIPVTSGAHRISVQVTGDDGSEHVSNSAANFARGSERELVVVARHADLSTTWAGSGNSVSAGPDPTPFESQPSWLRRYASALFLTIAGSIVSALSGYAIRELPARLRNRGAEQ